MSALTEQVAALVARQRAHLTDDERQALAAAYQHQPEPFEAEFAQLACARPARHRRVSHRLAAEQCRSKPGTWQEIGEYQTRDSAGAIAGFIRRADGSIGVWYQPARTFESRVERTDGGFRVDARYIGGTT